VLKRLSLRYPDFFFPTWLAINLSFGYLEKGLSAGGAGGGGGQEAESYKVRYPDMASVTYLRYIGRKIPNPFSPTGNRL
jgi:hypothetical protein